MIADELNKLIQTKADIKQALIDKGQNPTDEFASYSDNIRSIQSGGGEFAEGTIFSYSTFKELPEHYKSYIEQSENCDFMLQYNQLEGELELNLRNATRIMRMFANGLNVSYGDYKFTFINQLTKITLHLNNPVQAYGLFNECANLKEVVINGQLTEARNMFYGCSGLERIGGNCDMSQINSLYSTFCNCYKLQNLPDLSNCNTISLGSTFSNCSNLIEVQYLNTENATTVNYAFRGCAKMKRINGFSVKSITDSTLQPFGSTPNYDVPQLRYLLIKDLGTTSTQTKFYGQIKYWGIANDEITDARQSLIDSLITYSFDRATAGYNSYTITLSSDTKALLTEDEIAQITAKGYTLT